MLESLTQKQKFIFFIILAIMLTIIFYYIYSVIYSNNFSYSYEDNNHLIDNNLINSSNADSITLSNNAPITNTIVIYICGAVKENKVITLKENSRICDAIELAGGLTQDADLTNINLAYILEDGEKIYIPHKGEEITSIPSEEYTHSSLNNLKININKATQTELETIPGIGPSTALKIINYRKNNGDFSKIEDIKNISGIGESKYEKIKDFITVK